MIPTLVLKHRGRQIGTAGLALGLLAAMSCFAFTETGRMELVLLRSVQDGVRVCDWNVMLGTARKATVGDQELGRGKVREAPLPQEEALTV